MWDNLLRVDWGRLNHAYGRARDVPNILANMVSPDEKAQAAGWSAFWGSVNHQGDFYDSTVAAIPFLVEAADDPRVPDRASLLNYFRTRWEDAPHYGGDPVLTEPPGGVDEPTPLLSAAGVAVRQASDASDDEDQEEADEEFDADAYRRMDLCAWQTGRAILAGRPTFQRLLKDPDRETAAAAAALLLRWPESRGAAKQALVRTIEDEPDAVAQGRRVLDFGVYAAADDAAVFARWVMPQRPAALRAAAALAWAWAINPGPLPEAAAQTLDEVSAGSCDAFARLPWVGVWHRGPWSLPANAAGLVLQLADHRDKEVRWRAVQGLALGRETAKHLPAARVVPVLSKHLADRYSRVREAAAFALAQRGESILMSEPALVPRLLRALDDSAPSACGHAARLLVAMGHRLTPAQRAEALARMDRAAARFKGQGHCYVDFPSMGTEVVPFLKCQRRFLGKPARWHAQELLAECAFPDRQDRRLPPLECDRRLADVYAQAPQEVMAAAGKAVCGANDRTLAIGAAHWLMTLGPAAEPALPGLDAMAEGKLDSYAREKARAASEFIRGSLHVPPEGDAGEAVARRQATLLSSTLKGGESLGSDEAAFARQLLQDCVHLDPGTRTRAAEQLAQWAPKTSRVPGLRPALEKLLTDDAVAEVGIPGLFEFEGKLYHWRRERRRPRAAAIRALFQMDWVPKGNTMLRAMLAESMQAAVVCGRCAAPFRFGLRQWRSAVATAGGLAAADPLIRAARQQCHQQAWSGHRGDNTAYAAETELAEVLRQLSGRLV
jgi:hypothetical protein